MKLGVRPNDLRHLPDLDAEDAGFPCTVEVVEPLGWEVHVHARGEFGPLTARMDRPSVPEGLAPGAALRLVADPVRIHLFDAASGERLGP